MSSEPDSSNSGDNFDDSKCTSTPSNLVGTAAMASTGPTGDTTAAGSDDSTSSHSESEGGGDCMCRLADKIGAMLDGQIDSAFGNLNELVDKIINGINVKFAGPLYTKTHCQQMVDQGLESTLEYSIKCADNVVRRCDAVCSLGSPETEGQCCNTCGEECCICENGGCVPTDCPEEPHEPDEHPHYYGWCNPNTGSVIALRENAIPPGPEWEKTELQDSEQSAIDAAAAICNQEQDGPVFYPPGSDNPFPEFYITGDYCYLGDLANGATLNNLVSHVDAINMAQGVAQEYAAAARIGLDGINVGNIAELVTGAIRSFTAAPAYIASQVTPHIARALGCSTTSWSDALTMLGQINQIGQYIGTDFSSYTKTLQYSLNAQCRQGKLSPGDGMSAYLANAIKRQDLEDYWKIAGICKEDVKYALESSRAKPIPHELAVLRHRKIIKPAEYELGMRQLGYTKKQDVDRLWQSTFQVPTLSDIIRFMVRDADDDTVTGPVTKFNLDAEFTNKYGKQLKKWSEDQGIPEVVARYAWRSHWNIPSPTQLFEFYHRLRFKPEFGDLLGDVKSALIQQDILPYWHKHYLAVSFRPLTRVDVRRAYNIGAMKEEDVEKSYLDLGYSDDNARVLTEFTKRLRDDGIISHKAIKLWTKFAIDRQAAKERMESAGLPEEAVEKALKDTEIAFASSQYASAFARGDMTHDAFVNVLIEHGVSDDGAIKIAALVGHRITNHVAVKSYAIGMASRKQAVSEMEFDGVPSDVIEKLLNDTDVTIDQAFVMQCQRGIKRRYMMGELDEQEAKTELVYRNTSTERATKLLDWWGCEKSSTGKHVAASKLCDWLSKGTIGAAEFVRRLTRIGYDRIDADNMLADCLANTNAKRLREAQKEAANEIKTNEKLKAAQNKSAAAIARNNNILISARKKAAKAKANREKQLMSAAAKMSKKCSCDIYDSLVFMRSEQARLEREFGLGIDETLQVLIQSVEAWHGGDQSTLPDIVTAMAETAASVPLADESADAATLA